MLIVNLVFSVGAFVLTNIFVNKIRQAYKEMWKYFIAFPLQIKSVRRKCKQSKMFFSPQGLENVKKNSIDLLLSFPFQMTAHLCHHHHHHS